MHQQRSTVATTTLGASAVAVALALALAGCSGGGEAETPSPSDSSEATTAPESSEPTDAPKPTPTPSPTPEPVATPLTPEEEWSQSLCAALDTAAVEAATGRLVNGGEVGGADAQLPVNDRCSLFLLDPGTVDAATAEGSALVFGVSAAPVDAAGWQQLSDHYATTWGTFTTITPLTVADGGFAILEGFRAWAHAGDRVLYLRDQGNLGLPAEAYEALLTAAATAATAATPIQEVPACAPLLEAATAALGTEPTIQRGSTDGETCIWGTAERALTSSRGTVEQAAVDVQQTIANYGLAQIPGLGEVAAWRDDADGSLLIWAQGETRYQLGGTPGFNADQAAMIALATAVMAAGG